MSIICETLLIDKVYYIPHHCILKSYSSFIPCCKLFDASTHSDNEVFLNDVLDKVPKLQTNIVTILLIFRINSLAINADLKQMYR